MDPEPLPVINYLLMNHLISVARPYIQKRQLKRIEYLIDARRSFYEAHSKHQTAYRDLADAEACATILDKAIDEASTELAERLAEDKDVESAYTKKRRQRIVDLKEQRVKNDVDLVVRMQEVERLNKTRQDVSLWFSNLKTIFLEDEMPWLTALAGELYEADQEREKEKEGMLSLFFSSILSFILFLLLFPIPAFPICKI